MIDTSILPCSSNPEVQVNFKPIVQDVTVQVNLLRFITYNVLHPQQMHARVQCDIEYPLFESTPRIDSFSTSESEFPMLLEGRTHQLEHTIHQEIFRAGYRECV